MDVDLDIVADIVADISFKTKMVFRLSLYKSDLLRLSSIFLFYHNRKIANAFLCFRFYHLGKQPSPGVYLLKFVPTNPMAWSCTAEVER